MYAKLNVLVFFLIDWNFCVSYQQIMVCVGWKHPINPKPSFFVSKILGTFAAAHLCAITPTRDLGVNMFNTIFNHSPNKIVKRICPPHICRDGRYRTIFYKRKTPVNGMLFQFLWLGICTFCFLLVSEHVQSFKRKLVQSP